MSYAPYTRSYRPVEDDEVRWFLNSNAGRAIKEGSDNAVRMTMAQHAEIDSFASAVIEAACRRVLDERALDT